MIDHEFWTPERARVLGALIEKGLATPQNYPLSLNALVGACNQSTNRDPVTELSEGAVEALLVEAKADGLVRFVHPRHGRGVTKYRHVVDEALRLEPGELALVGVLLLRGPQTISELRARTERLAPFDGNDELGQALDRLAEAEARPLVLQLEREPGHRERRWVQLLCPAQGEDRVAESGPAMSVGQTVGDADRAEVTELRSEVEQLRSELSELRAAFDGFRRQFE